MQLWSIVAKSTLPMIGNKVYHLQ